MGAALLCVTVLAAFPSRAHGEGVVPIDQTCAVRTGCFPGDSPGFPVTIDGSAGRSYRLASDLWFYQDSVVQDSSAIEITAADVSIDLAGFRIKNAGCQQFPCVPPFPSGPSGIRGDVPGIAISNGEIVGFEGSGALLGPQARVHGIRARGNGSGIIVGIGSVVTSSFATGNSFSGIRAEAGCVLAGNASSENATANVTGPAGISAGRGSVLVENTARKNGLDGLVAGNFSVVVGNAAFENQENGIVATGVVARNTAGANSKNGIVASSGVAHGNLVYGSGEDGLSTLHSSYFENGISGSGASDVSGLGTDTGANSCGGKPTCP